MANLSAEAAVRVAAHAALEKKAIDLAVLDLQGLSSVADFFLVCSARSAPQADTIAEAIRGALRAKGVLAAPQRGERGERLAPAGLRRRRDARLPRGDARILRARASVGRRPARLGGGLRLPGIDLP